MVHLAGIPNDEDLKPPTVGGVTLESLKIDNGLDTVQEDEDDFTTTVYGSKYAALDLPRYEMPDNPMPKEVAYRMIK